MKQLIFATLFSGSSGNAVYISYGEDALLIDAGKNNKSIEKALYDIGEDPCKIKAVFITHEHSDHVSALPVFARKYAVPVHMPLDCAKKMYELPRTALLHEGLISEDVGAFHIESFYTPHDASCSMGYTVTVGGVKLGVATDMGMLAKSVITTLTGCYAALIECNYDAEMLEDGIYPRVLKDRVGGTRGHLSNDDGALLAAILAFTGTEHLLLGHLSKENNTPEKAYDAVMEEFERRKTSARVLVASRDRPTVLLCEEV